MPTWRVQTVTELRAACSALPGTIETFPFGATTLVWKVGAEPPVEASGTEFSDRLAARRAASWKMFALTSIDADPLSLSLKCDPVRAARLRELHEAITPGYHLNKTHWNTLRLDGSLPEGLVRELLAHSYDLVSRRLPRAVREALQAR